MKTRIKKNGKFFWLGFPILLAIFCSGCSSVGEHLFTWPSNSSVKSPVYKGTSGDLHEVFSKDKGHPAIDRVVFCVDIPFSLVADTLFLPIDLYHYNCDLRFDAAHREADNLLAGWKPVNYLEEPNQIIIKDYQDYIQQEKLGGASAEQMLKDGAGQHAIKIQVGIHGTTWEYVLIYDKDNKRIKTLKYYTGYYAS